MSDYREGMLDAYLNDTDNVPDRLLNPPSSPSPLGASAGGGYGGSFLSGKSPKTDIGQHRTSLPSRTKVGPQPLSHPSAPRGSSVKDENADTTSNHLVNTTSQHHRRQPSAVPHESETNEQQSRKTAGNDSGRRDDCSDEREERSTTHLVDSGANDVRDASTTIEWDRPSMSTMIAGTPHRPRSIASTGHMSTHHGLPSSGSTPSKLDNLFVGQNQERIGTQYLIDPELPPQSYSQLQLADLVHRAAIDRQDTSDPSQRLPESHPNILSLHQEPLVHLEQACENQQTSSQGNQLECSDQVISSPVTSAGLPTVGDKGASHRSNRLKNAPSSTTADSHAEVSLSNDSSEDGAFSREGRKKMLIDRLMKHFFEVLLPSLSDPYVVQQGTGLHDGNAQGAGDMRSSTTMDSSQSSSHKKNDGKKRSGNSDEGRSGGDGNGQKKRRIGSSDNGSDTLAFACPYIKRDVHRYWKSCPVRGWTTVHRVKQHLYRSHRQPITCPRCHEKFDTIPLRDVHLVEETRCEKKEKPDLEGFDLAKEQLLRRRQKSYEDEADNWRDIYMILFPDTDPSEIPSPYVNLHNDTDAVVVEPSFSRYERFLSQELPKIVERELETQVNLALEPLEERLKIQLVEIVRKAQRTAHDKFMSANSEPTKPQPNIAEAERSVTLEDNTREPHEAVGGFGTVPVLSFENAPGGTEDSGNFLHDLSLGTGPSSRQEVALDSLGTERFEDGMEDFDLGPLAIPEFNADRLEWMAQPDNAWPGFDDVFDG